MLSSRFHVESAHVEYAEHRMTAHVLQVAPVTTSRKTDFDLIAMDRDHAKAIAFNMLFMTWRFHTHATAVRPCLEIVESLAARFKEGVGVCHIVEADAIPPSAAARKLISEVLRSPLVKHYSVTHEGAGFKAASIRAVVAGIHALARPVCEHSVHGAISAAAQWHARQQARIGRPETFVEIEATFEELRRRHRKAYP
jgi:hypothetical protein